MCPIAVTWLVKRQDDRVAQHSVLERVERLKRHYDMLQGFFSGRSNVRSASESNG